MNKAPDSAPPKQRPIPLLRRDIKIYKGPDDQDGSPTYNCLDPIRAQYFKISWSEFTILNFLKPGMTISDLTNVVNKKSNLKVTQEEIQAFFEDAARNRLLELHPPSEEFLKEAERKKTNPIIWTLYHYLYVRVPIINPDTFLRHTLPYVRPLASTPAFILYAILTLIGLFFLIERFEEFINTFSYFFNLQGVIIYGSAIIFVKIIHEFSHAYTAKYYRLHIPTMGIAFIVLWPVLYTDVTDGWKLSKRSHRLAISFAGVASEIILAGLSTLGWTLSEPGQLQSIFFVISTVTWISTLAVNLNPAMRFDGYYLLSDFIGIDNLQPRAFAFTRWQLRQWLLGINVPPPEEIASFRRKIFMMGYSIYTWIYRIILYTVIAIFVYYKFTKALGIFLFMVEIAFFIIPPFFSEGKQLFRLRKYMHWNIRSAITSFILSALIFWFVVPLPHLERFPAVTVPFLDQTIYTPFEGKIEEIRFKLGDKVKPGQILLILSSQPIKLSIAETKAEIETVKAEMHVFSLSDENQAYIPEKIAQLAALESKLKSYEEQERLLTIRSHIEGTINALDDTLRPKIFISKNAIVGKIEPLNHIQVLAYVPEAKIHHIEIGEQVSFKTSKTLKHYKGKIIDISNFRANSLLYPALASTNKGDLPVVEKQGEVQGQPQAPGLIESYFTVRIDLKNDHNLKLGEKGKICVRGPWHSLLLSTLQYIESIYWRESGF